MVSPDWSMLAEKYILPRIDVMDYSELFGSNGKNIIHNQAFNLLNDNPKNNGKDIGTFGMVKHSSKMLPSIQKKLLDEKKVIKFTRNNKVYYRARKKWSNEEILKLKEFKSSNQKNIKSLAFQLNRSYSSVYTKLRDTD